ARRWDGVVVVAPAEAQAFGAGAVAIPHGVEIAPLPGVVRTFDIGFWGRLAYFANRDAARRLLDEIWPRIRAARPGATLLIAGADAPGFVRAADGRDGITVASPIADRRAWTSRVRVALFPVRFGTGQANKVMEAAESGCAVVTTPEGIRGLPELAAEAVVASAPAVLADAVISLLQDPVAAELAGQRLRGAVVAHYDRAAAGRSLAEAAFSGLE
ncbi:MAG: glycosyltransferase, partial [Acidobacteria bacterium]|nr:glycosyltransferase [Acidobacteriota bacterium]